MPERGRPAVHAQRAFRTGFAMTTNITEEHRRVFQTLSGTPPGRWYLFSCFCDWEPEYVISPWFVSRTPAMAITDHDCTEPDPGACRFERRAFPFTGP